MSLFLGLSWGLAGRCRGCVRRGFGWGFSVGVFAVV